NIPSEKSKIETHIGVNAEIIQHGLNGLHATSHQEWYEAIVDLLENPSKRRQLGEAGRAKVVEHYSKKAWTMPLIDVYKKAINKH
ncbi:MAG: glycosyltransferase, partial [Flavobacteriales bacterium]|nr:glycosyltransferase [Flavobacteriales bacterium]